ncbi:patatin-like phospholipase family protein [Streptosporangium lutulentum]|uniref:NTE family protein n=1 Tax=Streptosporangium lutulentum TaxID=1461250 RepID=A0ABT9Q7D4_9ACTN|nr:patatin-like phospholipase family protein [Streptosporangium lutulentum]MDP9842654.1 NTE family protein [Streptosporangium lutulentum]
MASRALVLGGGGIAGIAWGLGMVTGLAESGVDLGQADLVVGTSAGAVVSAQLLAGLDLELRYAAQLKPPGEETRPRIPPFYLSRLVWATIRTGDPAEFRARMGRMALAARTPPEAERRAQIVRWIGGAHPWPERRLVITAVDAESGEFVTFDSASGVELVDAVAASAATPGVRPPATVNGRRHIDGGMRSAANMDLAAGHERVVVLAPVTRGGGPMPGVADQVSALGPDARIAMISPDADAQRLMGSSLRTILDPARRAAVARAGRAQAAEAAERVAGVWHG